MSCVDIWKRSPRSLRSTVLHTRVRAWHYEWHDREIDSRILCGIAFNKVGFLAVVTQYWPDCEIDSHILCGIAFNMVGFLAVVTQYWLDREIDSRIQHRIAFNKGGFLAVVTQYRFPVQPIVRSHIRKGWFVKHTREYRGGSHCTPVISDWCVSDSGR
jgi:hypothetical protein